MIETTPSINCAQVKSDFGRPGITNEYLQENGIRHVEASEAGELVGCSMAGLLIPYFSPLTGGPIYDPRGKSFCRLRKSGTASGNKYHQPAGTLVHGYAPSNWHAEGKSDTLIVVEGEFKSIALTDKNQGYTAPTIGITGFYGFRLATDEGK